MLSSYGKREWVTTTAIGLILTAVLLFVGWWWLAISAMLITLMVLTFFRDPSRTIPSERGVVVSPADGRVSSIHRVEHFPPFDGPATCIRIFLSVMNVHVNRCPCHGRVTNITHKNGQHLNALNPTSAEANESNMVVFVHPTHNYPVAAVRQVAGLIARTIVCGLKQGDIVQRGQRMGMIKFGSTTELYLPDTHQPDVQVKQGQRVQGGATVLAKVIALNTSENPNSTPPISPEPKQIVATQS